MGCVRGVGMLGRGTFLGFRLWIFIFGGCRGLGFRFGSGFFCGLRSRMLSGLIRSPRSIFLS